MNYIYIIILFISCILMSYSLISILIKILKGTYYMIKKNGEYETFILEGFIFGISLAYIIYYIDYVKF